MIRFPIMMLIAAGLTICLTAFNMVIAQDKPLLSAAIGKAIDSEGIAAAKKQFAEKYESHHKGRYDIDMEGISALSKSYVESGNMEAAIAVAEISAPFMQELVAAAMGPEMMEKMAEEQRSREARQAEKQKKERAAAQNAVVSGAGEAGSDLQPKEQAAQQSAVAYERGAARDDLQRFTGLYADPVESDEFRKLWVSGSCDGYLVTGAMWGDVAPWWMTSMGDEAFAYGDSFTKIKMSFETDANGQALKMVHDLEFMKTPLERLGPLPDDW